MGVTTSAMPRCWRYCRCLSSRSKRRAGRASTRTRLVNIWIPLRRAKARRASACRCGTRCEAGTGRRGRIGEVKGANSMTWVDLPKTEMQEAAPPVPAAAPATSVAVETGRLQRLEGKRNVAAQRLRELQDERESLAWAAHADGDK